MSEERNPRAEIARLNKVVNALMDRAERSISAQGSDFTLSHTAIVLEDQVSRRTKELETALSENEKINRALRQAKTEMELEIQERKRAQQELHSAHAQLEQMLAHSPAVTYRLKMKGESIVSMTSSANITELLGFAPAEALSYEWWLGQLHPEDRPLAIASLSKTVKEGASCTDYRVRHKAGDYRWIEDNRRVLRDASGQPTEFVGIWMDIGERKHAEEELQWKTALLEAQVNSSLDGILVVDNQGKQIIKNERFNNLWKIPPHIAKEQYHRASLQFSVSQTKNPKQFAEKVDYLNSHPNAISRDEIELVDGTVLDRYTSPVLDQGGKCYGRIWTFRDITDRKRNEALMQEMHEKLLDASREAGMAEVASNVLHDVGNVLNSVNISVSVAADKVRGLKVATLERLAAMLSEQQDLVAFLTTDPRGAKLPAFLNIVVERLGSDQAAALRELDALRQHIEHINEIVAMQQNYAKVCGVSEMLPLTDLVEDALRLNGGTIARHDVQIVRDYTEMSPVLVDRHKVLQILVNLIRNATQALDDAAPAEKRLTLRLGVDGGGRAEIRVSDNGVGIPAQNLARIFEHGFTTRKNGHGFGLHSSANAAREMGGSLTAQSDGSGCGSSFTLRF